MTYKKINLKIISSDNLHLNSARVLAKKEIDYTTRDKPKNKIQNQFKLVIIWSYVLHNEEIIDRASTFPLHRYRAWVDIIFLWRGLLFPVTSRSYWVMTSTRKLPSKLLTVPREYLGRPSPPWPLLRPLFGYSTQRLHANLDYFFSVCLYLIFCVINLFCTLRRSINFSRKSSNRLTLNIFYSPSWISGVLF